MQNSPKQILYRTPHPVVITLMLLNYVQLSTVSELESRESSLNNIVVVLLLLQEVKYFYGGDVVHLLRKALIWLMHYGLLSFHEYFWMLSRIVKTLLEILKFKWLNYSNISVNWEVGYHFLQNRVTNIILFVLLKLCHDICIRATSSLLHARHGFTLIDLQLSNVFHHIRHFWMEFKWNSNKF